jgi:hypothetical protein
LGAVEGAAKTKKPFRQMTVTQARLKELLHYDPKTGIFIWIKARRSTVVGTVAGYYSPTYVKIQIDQNFYVAQRLAWLYMTGAWPDDELDHKDCDRHNNAWSNLRPATRYLNAMNSSKRKNPKSSKFKGVYWRGGRYQKWEARITFMGKEYYLGRFIDEKEAHKAYIVAAKKYCGEFARAA